MEERELEVNLRRVCRLIFSKILYIAAAAVFGLIAGFVFAKVILPVKYTSSISIYVNNYTAASDVVQEGKINAQDIQTSKALAGTYIVILQDDIVYDEVSDRLIKCYDIDSLGKVFNIEEKEVTDENGQKVTKPCISADQIRSLVNIEAVNETEVISITATTQNPELSADICTFISEIAPELLTRTTRAGSVETIGSAKIPTEPSSPNVKKYAVLGMLAGGFIAAAAVIIIDMLDNTINDGDDIKKYFADIPVLAEIPDLNDTKGGTQYDYK
ncbi:Capsular polysaccharide biosynthesis protein [Ruminococcus sp. YE71]|uniref:YveK family protein n=1 Tax=unclassified Ruminococcus TaxID=2608920 RepID=UPI00089136F2|nr:MULTISPECIES: Wzz/FepE/Etk N-terminal domain-containing protein [unclassified Ruminococcus]SDA25305.1 Capsular polysaccharide biosynthesis protein [Ruminococcus sp. YE78]SFW42682.1 Capsular polysaccharide biosynthesis protein [Ruminococcus sp. YE71]